MSRRSRVPPQPASAQAGAESSCQPAADAACGVCPDCREREARLFDDLLAAHLEAIQRIARNRPTDH